MSGRLGGGSSKLALGYLHRLPFSGTNSNSVVHAASFQGVTLRKKPGPQFGSISLFSGVRLRKKPGPQFGSIRRKRSAKRLVTESLISKMADYEGKAVATDVTSGSMIFEPIIEDGVFRFDCSANDRNAAYPSISFINSKDRDTAIMSHKIPSYIPNFQCLLGQQIVKLELPVGTSLYGTGEVSGQLERTGKRVFTWNTDAWGYGSGTTSLYQSHPWVLAVLPTGEALGILADTTRRCEIDLRKESMIQFIAPSSYPVITFGPFPSPQAVLISLSHAIGTVFMPPKWSLGYHQCRWSYDSDKKVQQERFPDPKSLVKGLNQNGEVWPGPCVFPDYTQAKVRSWWSNLVKDFTVNGVDGIWNDMNEPAVFKTLTKTMPESNIHKGDDELGGCQVHSHYHNVYGMLMARSTFEGMKLGSEKNRPFVLTRAGFIGSQRYAATWTGDNLSTWEHLHMSISMVLQLGLSGQPLSGPDIGGFAGNATPRLFGRWMGIGSMFPFCRGHSEIDTIDHEPWSFGKEDLPALYLQGGTIIPVGPPHQHVGESNIFDDLTLVVALDEHGKAKGVLYEDDGDGYEFMKGGFLLTHYVAELQSSIVTVKVSKTEGSWKRPQRRLHVQLLLGGGAMVDTWGKDGEVLQILMPSEQEVVKLVSTSEKQYRSRLENAKAIPDVEVTSAHKGIELSRTPVELKGGDWTQWLHSRVEVNGYEEYSGTEYRSAGCTEEYNVTERNLEHAGEQECLLLEGDIGGGLVLQRQIYIAKNDPKVFRIDSSIIARKVGAGSGGFSRLVCLRVHPMFTLLHPTESYVSFTAIDGSKHEIWPESEEQFYEGNLLPNGEWMLIDKCLGLGLLNRFDVSQVYKCLIHWGTGTVNLELWSEERPVSKKSPLRVAHEYEVITIA
ncbi:heteroglycan glucosidase 1 [Prunus dulcis]|uniref:Heteroglycan glucosidase 1 n=1 Tax=Prunus dulcis TaxID=3755 RepID=A0A4Y1REW1_PRUDU|nr:heteroglycan glucosidase 1 [Prunus dulcis]